jgi:hypothetical protein
MIMMQRRSTDQPARWHRLIERWGSRRARQALLLATALYLAAIIAVAVLLVRQGEPWERKLRAGLIGFVALVALWLWLRVLRVQWSRLRVQASRMASENEDTGIWGVGGPGMRTPGSTGLSRILPRRRAQDADEGDNLP